MLVSRAELGSTPIAVIDTETTGVYTGGHDRIIEIAIVRYCPDTWEIEDEYVTLVNPKRDIGRADIHGITAGELLHAPKFHEIAGDIGHRLNGAILAGHNIRFDLGFLRSEYARVGIEFPEFPALCTLHLADQFDDLPSRKLSECCSAAGIDLCDAHSAAGDARATGRLLSHYLQGAPGSHLCDLGCKCEELPDPGWIEIEPTGLSVLRSEAGMLRARDRGYLSRLVERLPGSGGSSLREAEYLCLLDHVLEDRALTREEADSLYGAAQSWGMSGNDVSGAHQAFVWALVRQAKADGVVTDIELRDLVMVTELLGIDSDTLVRLLDTATPTVPSAQQPSSSANALAGKSVCFTGELLGTIAGERVTREVAEELAHSAGMLIKPSVTKGLDVLVVADPDTQSSKAKKARAYGTRIMAEATFWRAVGATVD